MCNRYLVRSRERKDRCTRSASIGLSTNVSLRSVEDILATDRDAIKLFVEIIERGNL